MFMNIKGGMFMTIGVCLVHYLNYKHNQS